MNSVKPGHGFLAGLVGGLVLNQQTLVVLFAGVILGASGAFLLRVAGDVARWWRRRLDQPRPPAPYDWRRPW